MGEACYPIPLFTQGPVSVEKDADNIHIKPGLPLLPQPITDLRPPGSGQYAFQVLPRMPLVILIVRHDDDLSFWEGPKDIFGKA